MTFDLVTRWSGASCLCSVSVFQVSVNASNWVHLPVVNIEEK